MIMLYEVLGINSVKLYDISFIFIPSSGTDTVLLKDGEDDIIVMLYENESHSGMLSMLFQNTVISF